MTQELTQIQKIKSALTLARDGRMTVMRQCNTCRLANVCPVFEEDSDCKFERDVPEIHNDSDADKLMDEVIRLQMERVLHAHSAEKIEGSNASEIADAQIKLLNDLLKTRTKSKQASNAITIQGSGEQGVSVLGTLFANLGRGRPTSTGSTQDAVSRLNSKRQEKEALEDDVQEAEIIDVTPKGSK